MLNAVNTALEYGEGGYHSPDFFEAVSDWLVLDIRDASLPALDATARNTLERVRAQAFQSYIQEASDRLEHEGSKTKAYVLGLAGWIEKEAKKLNKKFSDPITECVLYFTAARQADRMPFRNVDLVPIVLQQHLTLWFRDMKDVMAIPPKPAKEGADMEEAFALYRRAQKLIDMGNAFST